MSTKSIKKVIEQYFKGTDFNEINNTITIETIWNEIVGNPIKKNTQVTSYNNGKIYIKTSNPSWRNELSLQKRVLLKKLQETQTGIEIKDIIFK